MTPSIPVGPGAGSQAPPQTQQGPSALTHMQASAPAPLAQAPVATTGADTTKGLLQMGPGGVVFKDGAGIAPVLEPGVNQPGDNTNVSSGAGTSGGFPTTGSRAPVTGSAPGPRNRGRVKTR
jgi:hypothetical protein